MKLLIIAALLITQALVAAPLPAPDGAFPVGFTLWHLVDGERPNTMTAADWDRREFVASAWYPALGVAGEVTPSAGVNPDATPMPVVLLAPGRGVSAAAYSALAIQLASHGYLVVGVDSPHSGRVTFPDGRIIPPSPEWDPPSGLFTGPYSAVDVFFAPAAAAGSMDLMVTLDYLQTLNQRDPANRFAGHLDLGRVGIWSHSLGGRIAGAAAGRDQRIRALMAVEGIAPAEVRRGGLDIPVAILLTANTWPYAIDNVREIVPARQSQVSILKLEGFGHNDVTDTPLLNAESEADDGLRFRLSISQDLALSFFNEHLRGVPDAFLDQAARHEAVTVEDHPAPAYSGTD